MNHLVEFLNLGFSRFLEFDPDSKVRMAELEGKILCMDISTPRMTLYLVPHSQGVDIVEQYDQEADIRLQGTLLAFAKLAHKGGKGNVLSNEQITMQGDATVGQAFQRVLAQMDLDWEELAAQYIGDTSARKLGNVLRGFGQWGKESAKLSRENLADYLKEEKQVVLSELSMQRFKNKVEVLKQDVDRVKARMDKLEQKLGF